MRSSRFDPSLLTFLALTLVSAGCATGSFDADGGFLLEGSSSPDVGTPHDSAPGDVGGEMYSSGDTGPGSDSTTGEFTIGGNLTGLEGSGLVLEDNGGDDLAVSVDGPFTFATPLANGASYKVTVSTQPTSPSQNCVVTDGKGKVAGVDVTTVTVTCSPPTYTIGGTLSGLASGDSVVLQDNGGDNLKLTTNGTFTFSTAVMDGGAYAVTVLTQPASPAQTCSVSLGSGTVASADVTNVDVSCYVPTMDCGRFMTGYTGAWSTVAVDPFTDGMGMSGYVPAGATATLYLLYGFGTEVDQYSSSSNTYTPLAAAPTEFPDWPSAAWLGNALWGITGGDVVRYDIAAGTWTTPTTGLTVATYNQTTNDDSGNLWTYASNTDLLEYNTSSAVSTMHTLTMALTGDEPRIVFDSCSGLLYVTEYLTTAFYSYDPVTGVQTALAGLPGGADFQDGFCGDRSGHIFAVTDSATAYQYTISTNTWVALPAGGVIGTQESACGVGADGYLYATDPGEDSTMYRILLQ
jgi:hypothetical protein